MPLKLKIAIFNEKGEVERAIECHSWTKIFLALQMMQWKGSLTQQMTDVTGVLRSLVSALMQINGGATDLTKGIIVGTGSTAQTPNDFSLQAPCANGVSANQFQYGVMMLVEPMIQGSNIILQISRQVTNGSSGSIIINEIGIYASQSNTFCIARDVVTPVTVTVGSTKTIQYTITESNT